MRAETVEHNGPRHSYDLEVAAKASHDGRLIIYFIEDTRGGFHLYAFKHPRVYLAHALPRSLVSIRQMQREAGANFLNAPIIPLPNEYPTIEEVAKESLSYLVPRFFHAEGKPLDFYRIDQFRTKEEPALRIGYEGNLIVVSYPNQEPADIP